jgi:hypothetical protein
MKENVTLAKHQLYLSDGKEVILDDVRVEITPDIIDENKTVRSISYFARYVTLENGKHIIGPSFLTDRLQPIGRVISLPETAR